MTATSIIRAAAPAPLECRPWPRHVLEQPAWFDMTRALPADPGLAFVALWADPTHIHALFQADQPLLASVAAEAGLYAALSPARPAAALFERMVADLWGHQAADAVDVRPWLDHGTWPTLRPLADRPVPNAAPAPNLVTHHLGVPDPEPPDMHERDTGVTTGPLPPTLASPAYWHLAMSPLTDADRPRQGRAIPGATPGPTPGAIHRLEARLGWSHRGILALMHGKSPAHAARLAARIDGAATIAHATAFARAVEAACATPPPPAAAALRELMLALERIAVGLHDLLATAEALGRPRPAAAHARETLLQACAQLTGNRLMLDAVRPGGVAIDPDPATLAALDATLANLPTTSFCAQDRTWPARGALALADSLSLAIPGPIGRASGRQDPADPTATLLTTGDLAARLHLRTAAIANDIVAARTLLANIPAGPTTAILPNPAAEGLGHAQGPTGPVWHWVRLANGIVAATFAAAPGWLHLPALERAAIGTDPAHLPALAASFALRPAGLDL